MNRHNDTTIPNADAAADDEIKNDTKKKMHELSPDRIAKLQLLGFEWEIQNLNFEEAWGKHFYELLQFRGQHGHTRVPNVPQTKLSVWVRMQRRSYVSWNRTGTGRKGLSDERMRRLEQIGFEWMLRSDVGTSASAVAIRIRQQQRQQV
jgi:hypothetical protein